MERDVEGEFEAEMDRAAQYEIEAEFERNLAREPAPREEPVKAATERTSKRPANKNEMGPGGRRKTRHAKKKQARRHRKTKRRSTRK
jgi:hypothetical protein